MPRWPSHPGLSISRKVGEKVVIGQQGEIVLEVTWISRGRVKISIQAPSHIPIKRMETLLEQEGRDA